MLQAEADARLSKTIEKMVHDGISRETLSNALASALVAVKSDTYRTNPKFQCRADAQSSTKPRRGRP